MNADKKDYMFLFGVHLRFPRDLRATKKPADHAESIILRQPAPFRFIRKFFGCGFAALWVPSFHGCNSPDGWANP
jgi:hypothetical protein